MSRRITFFLSQAALKACCTSANTWRGETSGVREGCIRRNVARQRKINFEFKLISAIAPTTCVDPVENDRLWSSEREWDSFPLKTWNCGIMLTCDQQTPLNALKRFYDAAIWRWYTYVHVFMWPLDLFATNMYIHLHKNCMLSFVCLYIVRCTMWSCEAFKWWQQPQVRIELKINWKLVKNP